MQLALGSILIGALIGVGTAILGYLKTEKPEDFDASKFFVTVLIGLLVGAIASYLGVTYQQAYEYLATAGVIVWLQWVALIIWRRLVKQIPLRPS